MFSKKITCTAAFAALALFSPMLAQEAQACSCLFSCSNTIVTDAKLASGAEGFYWFLGGSGVAQSDIPEGAITLEKKEGSAWVGVEYTITFSNTAGTYFLIKPAAGFEIGASYRLTTDVSDAALGCAFEVEQGSIEAVAVSETEIVAVTPGVKLGTQLGEPVTGAMSFESDGACTEDYKGTYRDLTALLPAELEGMKDSLFFEVSVDGQPYLHQDNSCFFIDLLPGDLDQARATTRLAALCEEAPDYAANTALSPGMHEVVISASLPESDVFKWSSDPITVELECPEIVVGEDMGADMGADMGNSPIIPDPADMGTSSPDMDTSSPDMGTSSADMASGQDKAEDGCTQAAGGTSGAPVRGAYLLGVLGLVGLWRRRKRGHAAGESR